MGKMTKAFTIGNHGQSGHENIQTSKWKSFLDIWL